MRMLRLSVGIVLVAVLAGGVASLVRADVTITMESEVKTPDGARTTTVKQYYTSTKMRSEHGQDAVSITDLDGERVITLMPALKMYFQQTLEQMKERAARVRIAEPKVTVEETDETEEISGYTCQKFIVRTQIADQEMVTEQWMTTEVAGAEAVHKFQKNMYEKYADIPRSAASLAVNKKFAEEGRLAIRTVVHTKGPAGDITSTMTVTKVEEGELDASLFEVPEDYTEQTLGEPGEAGRKE